MSFCLCLCLCICQWHQHWHYITKYSVYCDNATSPVKSAQSSAAGRHPLSRYPVLRRVRACAGSPLVPSTSSSTNHYYYQDGPAPASNPYQANTKKKKKRSSNPFSLLYTLSGCVAASPCPVPPSPNGSCATLFRLANYSSGPKAAGEQNYPADVEKRRAGGEEFQARLHPSITASAARRQLEPLFRPTCHHLALLQPRPGSFSTGRSADCLKLALGLDPMLSQKRAHIHIQPRDSHMYGVALTFTRLMPAKPQLLPAL